MFGNLTLAKDDLQVLQITEFASMGLPLILFRLSSSNELGSFFMLLTVSAKSKETILISANVLCEKNIKFSGNSPLATMLI